MNSKTRRDFFNSCIKTATIALMMNSTSNKVTADTENPQPIQKPDIVVFSKYFQHLKIEELAKLCFECELDGIDLTVRDSGHIPPEKVEDELPRSVEIFKQHNVKIAMITTRLLSANDPYAEQIIRSANQAGIRYVRIGYHKYNFERDLKSQISTIISDLKSLVTIAEKYNVVLGYHNHSGFDNFGGPIWDLLNVFQEINSPWLGSNFDVAHAKAEGFGGAWKTNLYAMLPWIKMIAVKDFSIEHNQIKWQPLGSGCVPVKEMLEILSKRGKFIGPISIHLEYNFNTEQEKIDHVKNARKILKEIIS